MLRPVPQQAPIPLSSLLPPSSTHSGPSRRLPSPAYLLGPLPSTSPLHLALSYLSSDDASRHAHGRYPLTSSSKGKQKEDGASLAYSRGSDVAPRGPPARVLVIAGGKGGFQDLLAEEDEEWFRNYGGYYEVVQKLKRVDMRYCPTPGHLQALLTVISEDAARHPPHVEMVPGVVVMWDAAGLFMCEDEGDLPSPAGEGDGDGVGDGAGAGEAKKEKKFRPETCISDYLNVTAAARATADHLSSLHPSEPPVHLVILEPNIDPSTSLPVQPAAAPGDAAAKRAKTRDKTISLIDGARWLLGRDAVGIIELEPRTLEGYEDDGVVSYSLSLDEAGGERFGLSRRPCGRGEWNQDGGTRLSGYRWEWV